MSRTALERRVTFFWRMRCETAKGFSDRKLMLIKLLGGIKLLLVGGGFQYLLSFHPWGNDLI